MAPAIGFTLYLAPWQVRLAKDFLTIRQITKVVIKPGVIKCPASYKIPIEGLSRRDWVLYLTDEQMTIVKEQFKLRTAISGININQTLLQNKSVVFA